MMTSLTNAPYPSLLPNSLKTVSGNLARIPITQFARCWDSSGVFATSRSLFKRVDVLVPSSASKDKSFAFCLTNLAVE
jgi:hypothetical protein